MAELDLMAYPLNLKKLFAVYYVSIVYNLQYFSTDWFLAFNTEMRCCNSGFQKGMEHQIQQIIDLHRVLKKVQLYFCL